jgi:SPP1 gp7 family putative phage head morphogenesis protein
VDIPIISKRRAAARRSIETAAITKTLQAVGQSLVETGTLPPSEVEKAFGPAGKAPGSAVRQSSTSWSTTGALSSQLSGRIQQNLASGFEQAPEELELALAEQGLSWGPPFPPGRPLDPFFGYRKPPRTFDYAVGTNTQLTPRWNRVSFPTIKSVYEAYDVAQICVRHLINDVRSLDYNWEPIPGIKSDVADDIEAAIAFFDSPDKRQPFRTWLAEFLQDVLRYDAGCLYIRRNEAGDPIALEVISGPTIIPLVDFYGRRPEDEDDENATPAEAFGGTIVPAYVQIVEGMPWDWLAADDIIYQPWNPLPDSQYGLAPLEAVLLSANTDIRFQWHFLQFFTEGTMPAGFMEAPPEMSDPAQIANWQETWDAVMQGDQTKLRQIRWVPSGSKFTEAKPASNKFDSEFPLYLMRRTCASFGVTPNDMGFTENVNRATGDTQVDVQFRVGTSPLLRYVEDIINLFTKQHLKLRCRLRIDDGKETEDRVATATADGIYVDHGVKGVDEVRQELGLPIDKSRPISRFVNNSRVGPIPLLALESMSGSIDAETYGPADSQELVDTPYVAAPGVIPPAGTPEQKASAAVTGEQANALRAATGPTDTNPESEAEEAASVGAEETPVEKMLKLLDIIEKDATAGLTVATGVRGADLDGDDDDDEDEDAIKSVQIALSLRRWRDNSRNRMRKGLAPKRFVDPTLPDAVLAEVWTKLRKAGSRAEVDAAFAGLGKKAPAGQAGTPGFHRNTEAIVDYYAPLLAKAYGALWSKAAIDRAIKSAAAKGVKKEAVPSEGGSSSALQASIDQTALQNVLEHLQGDAAIQGTLESAVASSSIVSDAMQCVVNQLPKDYWDKWQPGFGKAAEQDLADLREARGVDIKGLTDAATERVDQAISDGLANGDSFQSIASGIKDDLGSMSRSEMVANTEYASAMTEANLETYKAAGIEQVEWLAEGDACVECEENADASPLSIDDEWPNGDVPVHPNCRCAIAPVVEGESESPEVEKALPGEADVVGGLFSDKSCSVVKPELPIGAEGKVAEAVTRTEEATSSPAAKIGDRVHFQSGTDAQTGKAVEGGAGRIARMDKQGNMMVNTGTPKKPVWVQTRQDALITPERAKAVDNPLGMTGYRDRLTIDERKALDDYKATGYLRLNEGLRTGKLATGKPITPAMHARVDAIDRAIEKGTLSKDTTLFRSFRPTEGLNLEVGDVIKDDAFISTSTSTKAPMAFASEAEKLGKPSYVARIQAPSGTHVAYADAQASQRAGGLLKENEIILPRGTSFKVTKVRTNKYGLREVELELISAAMKGIGRVVVVTEDESTLASTIAVAHHGLAVPAHQPQDNLL